MPASELASGIPARAIPRSSGCQLPRREANATRRVTGVFFRCSRLSVVHDLARQNRTQTSIDAGSAPGRHLAIELAETLKLAVPIALTQLGQIAMMTTDIAMIGRLGAEAVAAASLAHTVFFVSFTFGMGLVSAVAPLAAQAFGARNPHLIRRSLRVGLWAALLISLPLMALAVLRRADPADARPGARRPRISRSNICSAWSGASCRRCGSWRSAAS